MNRRARENESGESTGAKPTRHGSRSARTFLSTGSLEDSGGRILEGAASSPPNADPASSSSPGRTSGRPVEEDPGAPSGETSPTPPPIQPDVDQLDWTEEVSSEAIAKRPEAGPFYDPRPKEDEARRRIAYTLIALLWTLVVGILLMIALKSITVADIEAFAVLLGPVVTLVSAATGFYYGTKAK